MDENIPENWMNCLLEDVILKITNGSSAKQYNEKVGYPITRIETIWNEKIDLHRVKYVKEHENEFVEKYSLKKYDILLSHINSDSHLGKTAIFKNETENLIHGINLLLIRSSSILNADFLNYQFKYLKFKGVFIDVAQRAVNQSSINQRKLKAFNIKLPPFPEQRAIVSKIEQLFSDLDNGIENFKKAQEQLKIYRQAVLKNACEGKLVPTEAELACAEGRDYEPADVLLARILEERREKWNGKGKYKEPAAPDTSGVAELPEGWEWTSINQISHYIVDCLHSTPKFVPVGMYCIDTNCIKQAKILFDKARFVSEETYNERVSRLAPEPDDILFAREGTIGTAVIVPQNTRLCLGQRMMMFRATNGVIPLYFMWALQSQVFKNQWKIKVLGTTVPHVNIGDIKVMAMPLPPTLEQRRIVSEIETRLSICDKMEETIAESLEKAESLRQSILKKAFEGKLLNKKELEEARNAPDWEPAEKLLERIKAQKNN